MENYAEGMSKKEDAKFLDWFKNEYAALYPPPALEKINLNWKFQWSIVTSVATVILASLRTAQMFYNSAELSAVTWGIEASGIWIISVFDAFVSMLAVEGGLVVASAIRSNSKKTINEDIYLWQIGILVTISVMAGLGQSVGLVQNLPDGVLTFFSYALSFVLGVGASLAAWFSGEVLGVLLNTNEETNREAKETFQSAMEMYQKNARKFWKEKKEQERLEKQEEKFQKSSETSGNQSEKIPENSRKFPDWNSISEDELKAIANWSQADMEELAQKYGKTVRTFSNYRKHARVELGIDTESNQEG